MYKKVMGPLILALALGGVGCSSNQDVKNVWKGTKDVWYDNVNVSASIDYDDKGDMSEYQTALARSMMGIDIELTKLEKIMSNADKPPTNEWIQDLFRRFPWINGFVGIKADGSLLGQVPGPSMKPLDFLPLLSEDNKQNLRALRGHVQDTPMGPEVFLATPLYDSQNFLGVVSVYFDMRALLQFSDAPDDLLIISPQAVLWGGKYTFGSTPLAGIAWDKIVLESTSGTISNANGTFYWTMRYLGNQAIIFAVPVKGSFGEESHSRTGSTHDPAFVHSAPVVPEDMPAESEMPSEEVSTPSPIHDTPAEKEEVAAPSPIHEAPAEKEEVATPSPIHEAPADEDVKETDTTTEETASEPAQESAPANDESYTRPSPFGPK